MDVYNKKHTIRNVIKGGGFPCEKQFDPDYQPTKQVQEELGLIPFAKSKGKEENKRTKQNKRKKTKENRRN